MHNRELARQLQVLRALFSRSGEACGGDIEMMSHWARYLCVLAAGFVENAVRELYGEFVASAASEPVASFASFHLRQVQNPKTHRLLEIAGSFQAAWRSDLEVFVDSDGRKEAIDSIMQNRHQIAHGQYSSLTIARLREYLDKAVEVMEYVEEQCRS